MSSDRRHDGATLRMTPRQEAFWLEDALFPAVPCNHVVVRLVIDGDLDAARFAAAFAKVVEANDAMRLAFDPAGGPQLRPVAAAPDLAQAAAVDADDATRWRRAFLQPRFRVGEPLWRAALLRLGAARHEFVLAQHHVVTDSRSCLLFVEQLAAAYAGAVPAVSASSFGAAMAAQRRWLDGGEAAAAADFWRERLADSPPPCRLYGRDPAGKTAATRRVTVALPAETTAALAARAAGASPAQWFAAATLAWLQRVGEGEEFVVGVPLLNREPAHERTLGLLMEIVPNRVAVAPTATMRELLGAVQAEVARVRPHRRWTVPARQARCDVLLNVHPEAPTRFAGLPCRYELTTPPNLAAADDFAGASGPWAAREAVTVQVHRHGDGPYEVSLDANGGMFDAALVARGLGHLVALLVAGLRDPDATIAAASILGAEEARLAAPRRPAAGAPATMVASFLAAARRGPDRVAVRHRERSVSYRELMASSATIAGALRAANVGPGDRVAVCLRRAPELLAALLACARLGAAYVPLDPSHPGARLQLILADAAPRACVLDGDGRAALGELAAPCVDLDAPLAAAPVAADEDRSRPDGVAYVLFTSGSTGRPKGVEVLHHGLGAFLAAMAHEPGCGPDDRVLALTTVSFDIAALELWLPLTVGAEVVLADRADAVDPAALARLVAARAVTLLQATPATFHLLVQNDWPGRPGLRALVGGEALPPDLAAALLPRVGELWNMYGPTETTVWSTCMRVGTRQPIAIGRPSAGTAASVRTPAGALCPLGAVGELWLGGDGVAKGYLARPELTAERFVDASDGRWYRTGDLARLADDGVFEFLGRNDFQVKVRGYRIELGEIEAAMAACPGVRQAVVVARGSGPATALVGYAQGGADAPSLAELDAWLRARVPAYMVPARLCVLERFPLTPSGKVDRKALPEPAAAAPVRAPAGPRAPYEARIAAYWSKALGDADPTGAQWRLDDDFFAVGGHSLAALELARLLQDGLGLGIDVGAIFARPTLRQQVALAEAGGAGETAVVTLAPGAPGHAPIYAACGISLYAPLARALQPERPFHAVFVPEEESGAGATASATELAAAYWRRIRAHHRGGPFHLVGFCYGGIVAFEIARLARAEGAAVGVVALVDTALWGVMRRNRVQQVWRRLRRLFAGAPPAATAAPATAAPAAPVVVDRRAEDLFERARAYRPSGPHDGLVVLARARRGELLATWRPTPFLGWEPWLAGERALVEVDGAHEMLLQEPAVGAIAAALRSRL